MVERGDIDDICMRWGNLVVDQRMVDGEGRFVGRLKGVFVLGGADCIADGVDLFV